MMRTNVKVTNEEKIFQHDKLIVNGQSQETIFFQESPFKAVFLNPGPGHPPTLRISPLSDTPISGPGDSSNELMS